MTKLSIRSINSKKISESENTSPLPSQSKADRKVPTNKSKEGNTASNKPKFSKGVPVGPKGDRSTGRVQQGQTPKAPSSKTEPKARGAAPKMKPVKAPSASQKSPGSKSPSSSAGPSDAGFRNKSGPSAPAVGASDTIKGSFFPGMNPSKYDCITLKVNKGGGFATKAPKIAESVIDGTLALYVGGKLKKRYQATSAKTFSKIVESYVDIGRRVGVVYTPGARSCYKSPRFHKTMLEAAHYGFHGASGVRKDMLAKGFKMMVESTAAEHSAVHGDHKKWVSESVKSAFRQVIRHYDDAYRGSLRDFEVQVRTETKFGDKDSVVRALGLTEAVAGHAAADKVIADSGLSSRVKHVIVDGRKLSETYENGIFSLKPQFFADLPGPMGPLVSKKSDGSAASNKPAKPQVASFGKSSPSGKGPKVVRCSLPKRIGVTPVDRDPKPTDGRPVPKVKGYSASTPVYENIDPITYMEMAAKKFGGNRGAIISRLIERVQSDEKLTANESHVLDILVSAAAKA